MMIRILSLLLLFTGCSNQWYLTKSVKITDKDMPVLYSILDSNRSDLENLRGVQQAVGGRALDFWIGSLWCVSEGTGLGLYESKVFYGSRAFPGQSGPIWDWYRMDGSGDQWMKIGQPDKIFRTMWIGSGKAAWNRLLRFYSGNWVYSYLHQFILTNSVAGLIRKFGKKGEFYINIEFDWRAFDALLGN